MPYIAIWICRFASFLQTDHHDTFTNQNTIMKCWGHQADHLRLAYQREDAQIWQARPFGDSNDDKMMNNPGG